MQIQNIPVTDSPNNDAFEALVEVYYQTQGYITSSGKWFWAWDEENKKQRGYQDIDVLAVNGRETIIVSVSSNLDDKINTQKSPENNDSNTNKRIVNEKMITKLYDHFDRVKKYLEAVKQYNWLAERKIRCVVAYATFSPKILPIIIPALQEKNVELISTKEMLRALNEHTKQPNLKIQNQLLRAIQLFQYKNIALDLDITTIPSFK